MPAKKSKAKYFASFYRLFVLLLVSLSIVNLVNHKLNSLSSVVYATPSQNDKYWENIIDTHPTYRDAYIVLASIHRSRGEIFEAQKLVAKAKELDPYLVYEEL